MKIRCFYRICLLLLLALFYVPGGLAFPHSTTTVPAPDHYDYLQQDRTSIHLFAEIRTVSPVQIITKDNFDCGLDFNSNNGGKQLVFQQPDKLTTPLIQDKKEILKTYIFPFHFFW